jgi:hypothetical protein
MPFITVKNQSGFCSVHCVLTTGGVQRDCKNNIGPRGGYDEFNIDDGWPGLDLTVIPGTKANQFDPSRNHTTLDLIGLIAAAGFVPYKAPAMLEEMVPKTKLGSLNLKGAPIVLKAVQVSGLYAPDSYDTHVSGGDIVGDYDEETNSFTVSQVTPLRLHWSNRKSGTQGDEVAAT